MDPTGISYLACIVAVGTLVLTFFLKSPKEHGKEIERRIGLLEGFYASLSMSNSRHDQALSNLTSAVNRLTDRFERYMEIRNGHGG